MKVFLIRLDSVDEIHHERYANIRELLRLKAIYQV
jgi:hypothetical protein